ncbi:hypothetical protein [Spongiivirga citrea]|uniref:Uncharacterized protein n=1 Tax=Spongiivirga citrea TaxID=1481457 RepID=A0A6M0CS83_9FLAO|nr:hypothetical protein [Spongiivirga citrea]NER16730.1 hypothetical protein [Spongiivirga citrea]
MEMKKIKMQKNAAIILIIVPLLKIISYLLKNDFEIGGRNYYIIGGSLIVLMICGSVGLRNSLRKEKALKG